ncbi:amino acid ABC transporter permease [Rhizobium sp. L1K21]|uniref:amino acid ABC transporter permease n=1 Tax=Rhizobium sp. L1K21 TaxID=2954933 RepID=UPI0020927591|nr:amino acid ABC transporter permease [Rhizobium sp. L1K21]MCO6187608.1 amino acid ABC transporter permease [Rhizobium sp. L1K21]
MNFDLILENRDFFLRAAGYAVVIFVASTMAAMALSLAFGSLATVRLKLIRMPVRIVIEVFRDIPQVVLLFFIFFGAPAFGLQLGPLQATILCLSLWGGANGAEIVRGGINAVPRHQFESARSLGLGSFSIFVAIILPQALRPVIPAYAGLCNILMHSTSLGALVGVVELLKSGQIVIDRASYYQGGSPGLTVYGFILVVYFIAGLLMNAGIRGLERHLGRSSKR